MPLKNIPEKSKNYFLRCLTPITIVQYITGSSRINIGAQSVYSLSMIQNLYTLLLMGIITAAAYYFQVLYYRVYSSNTTMFYCCAIGVSWQHIGYMCNMINIRCLSKKEFRDIFSTLQKLDRILRLNNDKRLWTRQLYGNIVLVCLISSAYLMNFLLQIFQTTEEPYLTLFLGFILVTLYTELLLTGSLINSLSLRLRFVNLAVKDKLYFSVYKNTSAKTYWLDLNFMKEIENKRFDTRCLDEPMMFLSVKLILIVFKDIAKISSFQVMIMITSAFIWPLLAVETLVVAGGYKLFSHLFILSVIMWCLLYFTQILYLSVVSEKFLQYIGHTRSLCIEILAQYYEGHLLETASKILYTIEWQRPRFSVYNIFTVERYLPLKLLRVITDYIIILIQFTLL